MRANRKHNYSSSPRKLKGATETSPIICLIRVSWLIIAASTSTAPTAFIAQQRTLEYSVSGSSLLDRRSFKVGIAKRLRFIPTAS